MTVTFQSMRRRLHAPFGPALHLTVDEVWDSAEEFEAAGLTGMPILADEQVEMAPAEPLEIHRLIVGGEASVPRKPIDELREEAFLLRRVEKLREKIHKAEETSSEEDKPIGSAPT